FSYRSADCETFWRAGIRLSEKHPIAAEVNLRAIRQNRVGLNLAQTGRRGATPGDVERGRRGAYVSAGISPALDAPLTAPARRALVNGNAPQPTPLRPDAEVRRRRRRRETALRQRHRLSRHRQRPPAHG